MAECCDPNACSKVDTTCGLCSKVLKMPKQLPCCHTFCRNCLEGYVKDMLNTDTHTIDCPKCQKIVYIPENGTKGLPSNYYILAKTLPDLINIESGDLSCDFCKTNQKAVGYCFECAKNLCLEDKEKHKSAPLTRSHHIATLMDDHRGKIEKLSYCERHPDNILKFYCVPCEMPICSDCKLAKHENHQTEDIADRAVTDREQLSKLIEILQEYQPCMNESVVNAENIEAAFKNHANDTIECINNRREEVKNYVDVLCDGAINYVRGKLQAELQCMIPKLNDIREDRMFIERSISTTQPILELEAEDVKIVTVTKEIQNIVKNLPEPKTIDEKKFMFNAGVYGRQHMANFVGTIGFEAKKITLDYTFDTAHHLLDYSIVPVSETDIWISYYNTDGSVLSKISSGKEVDNISLQPFGRYRVILLGDDFLLSSKGENKLKVWKNYVESDFAETPIEPKGLALMEDNTVVVCCSSDEEDSQNNQSAIMVYSQRGKLLNQIDAIKDDEKKIFVAPKYVSVNINGNICVSDEDGLAVIIFNKSFKIIGRYEGQQLQYPFRPRGLCCDRFGRILVTDGDNNCIHMLSHSGEFIRYVLDEQDGLRRPILIALGPSNKLWVACMGVIRVYSYLDGAGLLSRPTSPQVRG